MNILGAVAARARVSTATVSRVINGTANVSPETAERVREAIEALNFYPDISARTLGSGTKWGYTASSFPISLTLTFPELVKAFEDIAVQHWPGRADRKHGLRSGKRMEACGHSHVAT